MIALRQQVKQLQEELDSRRSRAAAVAFAFQDGAKGNAFLLTAPDHLQKAYDEGRTMALAAKEAICPICKKK